MTGMKQWLGFLYIVLWSAMGAQSAWAETTAVDMDRFGVVRLGGMIGANIARFGGEDAETELVAHTNRIGFAVNGFASLDLHRYLTFKSGVVYSDQGARLALRGEDQGSVDLAYLHIPVLLQVRAPIEGRITPYAVFGPALGILVSAVIHTNRGNTDDIKDDLPSLDVGLIFGLGASMDVSSSGALVIEAQHIMGMRSLYADDNEDIKNRVWTLSLGYQHRFGG